MGDLNTGMMVTMTMVVTTVAVVRANSSTLPVCHTWYKGHMSTNTLTSHHSLCRQRLSPQNG